MNLEAAIAASGERVVRAALIGVGQFGVSLVTQCTRVARLEVVVLCDREPARAEAALRLAGFIDGDWTVCDSIAAARTAMASGRLVVTDDAAIATACDVDIVVEATGVPEAAAVVAETAIANGKHVAMVTKEAESVIGSELHALAAAAGVVYTPVEGDQPGLLLALLGWTRVLGLPVVAAGKSSEYDFVFDPMRETVTWRDRAPADLFGFEALWRLPESDLAGFLELRAHALDAFPKRTVPDLCEMQVVLNATELAVDAPGFHVPVARATEVPEILRPQADGGILSRPGVVDVFNCLRRPDELSFAGGVFVVVECTDQESWTVLREKGHVVTADARHAMLYNPQHLLGLEAVISILQAVLLGHATTGGPSRPRYDLVARTNRDYAAGERLAIDDAHHHEVHGLDPLLLDAAPVSGDNPLPYYMAVERTLARAVPAGTVLSEPDFAPAVDSALARLRAAQDARFFR